MISENYIDLNRTFYQLPEVGSQNDEFEREFESTLPPFEKGTKWSELINESRVVILSEAGSGKSSEIYHTTKKLRTQGLFGFFIRIEDICDDIGFEVGTEKEFARWLEGSESAWIFLDSVDEAKLADPRDFRKAIRKFSGMIEKALDRAFIFITSRASSWSYKTDLSLCNQYLKKNSSEEYDFSKECFKVYSLTDLDGDQIEKFLVANNVSNQVMFLVETQKQEARMFASRPQDLLELINYWKRHESIGSKYQLIEHSIERRLEERHENHALINPISKEKLRSGVEKIAVAMILTKKFNVKVPDGSYDSSGVDLQNILPDWDNRDCKILLSRPIFDDVIYGSVRFHHRSVREYLAAKWFSNMLGNGAPRSAIENLFFKDTYGAKVIVPSMRHILPWLAQMDEKIRCKVIEIDPHAILEGGDPAMFPCHVREQLFEKVCSSMHDKGSNWHFDNWEWVKKMANPDVAEKIKQLLNQYSGNSTIISLLLDSASSGGIAACLPAAGLVAVNTELDDHAKISAVRFIRDFDEAKLADIRKFLVERELVVGRSLAKELITGLPREKDSLTWLMQILNLISDVDDYRMSGLTNQLIEYSGILDLYLSADFGKLIRRLLDQEPFIEKGYVKISQKHSWLFDVSLSIIEKLLMSKSDLIFQAEFIELIVQVYPSRHYNVIRREHKLNELINKWIEFKHYLFWQGIEVERKRLSRKNINYRFYYHTRFLDDELQFAESDLPLLLGELANGSDKDNQTIALTVCLRLYKQLGRPQRLLNSIKRIIRLDVELTNIVFDFLHPPKLSKEDRSLMAQDKYNKGRWKAKEQEEAHVWNEVVKKIKADPDQLRNNGLAVGRISNFQYYAFEKTRTKDNNGIDGWISTDWRSLISVIGEEGAVAYRDGISSFWRQYEPERNAETVRYELTEYFLFAFSGIEIEAMEVESWHASLNDEEFDLACRYAFASSAQFPTWFQRLLIKKPSYVRELIFKEIEKEALMNVQMSRTVTRIFYYHKELWDELGIGLMILLRNGHIHIDDIGYAIRIIESIAQISDKDLADLASYKCKSLTDGDSLPIWYTTWIGTEPDPAIDALTEHLRAFEIEKDAQEFVMRVISSLMGTRGNGGPARQGFKNPKSLRQLILMTYTYIRREDDFERAGKGVYSPGLRDEAQDARNRLEKLLEDIPGKESFLAMMELSRSHPHVPYRKWMLSAARERARIDSTFTPYSENEFQIFANTLERTPTNHKELYELAMLRLLDLKADLEDGDNSYALSLIGEQKETRVRNVIGGWCRDRSNNRYSIVQEEELADSKKPDLRFLGNTFDAPVPVELKLANRWSAEGLMERLENQLCGDYLRDNRSNCGIYLLINQSKETWRHDEKVLTFEDLVSLMKSHWATISGNYHGVDSIEIIGIDLRRRSE